MPSLDDFASGSRFVLGLYNCLTPARCKLLGVMANLCQVLIIYVSCRTASLFIVPPPEFESLRCGADGSFTRIKYLYKFNSNLIVVYQCYFLTLNSITVKSEYYKYFILLNI